MLSCYAGSILRTVCCRKVGLFASPHFFTVALKTDYVIHFQIPTLPRSVPMPPCGEKSFENSAKRTAPSASKSKGCRHEASLPHILSRICIK